MVRTSLSMLVLAAALAGPASAQPASIAGRWITATGNVEIAIGPCEPTTAEPLCGDVARVMGNRSMEGAGAAAVPPPQVGARLLSATRADGDHWRGRLYNRENQRTYDCHLRRLPDGSLEVRAFVGSPLLGKTQIWKPA